MNKSIRTYTGTGTGIGAEANSLPPRTRESIMVALDFAECFRLCESCLAEKSYFVTRVGYECLVGIRPSDLARVIVRVEALGPQSTLISRS